MKSTFASAIAAITLFGFLASAPADIGVRGRSDGGLYQAGGSWVGGGWPANGSLYQLIWSPVAPVIDGITPEQLLNGKPGEVILLAGATTSYGYATPGSSATIADFPGVNNGWIFMRIFETATPALGEAVYQSVNPTGPVLPDYDALNPTTIFDHYATVAGQPRPMNILYTPEPSTLAMIGIGAFVIAFRRRH